MSAAAVRRLRGTCARSLLVGLLLCAGLAGCESEPAVLIAEPGRIEPAQQRPGDAQLGYDILVNAGYVTCGIPYEAYAASRADDAPRYPLAGRTGRNAELPHDLNATVDDQGVEIVVTNCLACHAAPFEGELIVGLGDAFRDFSVDPRPTIEGLGLLVADGAPADAWARWADRMHIIASYMITDTAGVNPAPNVTLALMAHRDPRTLQWHDEPLIEPPPVEPLPTKVPPWWRMSKRHSLFHHAAGRGDHVPYMMLKSLLCTDERDEASRLDEWFTHVRAYLESIEPPQWPFALDEPLAARGAEIYAEHCAGCHGGYGADTDYPNLLIALDEVGTDPAYAQQAVRAERFIAWFNGSFYGRLAQTRPGRGYVAPPLDGVWATAPYLHNGSVPSLEALLDSPARPTYWRHETDPREYDPVTLGWRFEELDAAPTQRARRIYDTTRPGYGNQGHTYGDALAPEDRSALLEYLKTL